MDEFLRKLQLSEYAIEIYLKILNKAPRSYYELYSIVPKATPEEFDQILGELKNTGLIVQLISKDNQSLNLYSALPPILPILNYYKNINANLASIKSSIHELMLKSLNTSFEENKAIKLDSILNSFEEIRKDIEEDSIIQKQEIEDIVEGMEELKDINENLSELHKDVKSITQTKFSDLIKIINEIKTELVENIKKKEIVSLIEETFKLKLDNMIKDFNYNLHELIEKKFDNINKPIKNKTDLIFQYRNDFKMLLLNMLTNFETNMNKIHELLRDNKDNLSGAMRNLENAIAASLNNIIQSSINELSNLNKPIETLMESYLKEINSRIKSEPNYIWIINSITQINELIQKLILTSKENLTIIIPHLENHIAIEHFEKIADNLKIKIVSSEAHTNSTVKNFKNITNILYRSYQNENLIVLKSDTHIIIGIIQESKDLLYDFVGIGSYFEPLIKLIDPIIKNIWEMAYSDTFHSAQMAKSQGIQTSTSAKSITTVRPIISSKTPFQEIEIKDKKLKEKKAKPDIEIPSHIQEIQKDDPRAFQKSLQKPINTISPKPQITDLKQKLKEKIDFLTEVKPNVEDEAAIEINNAFNNLIQKLNNLKGDEFGKELQNIADLVLEKKGFSVTLHKVRSIINKFKEKLSLLDENDKNEIIQSIENWKKKLY
ncbi:MAG: hypothetical protein ACFE9Z_13110 [Promethearchaeota archaeon]